ncbi:hypothetical protein H0H87_002938 [Tephrocybe sp. NHM501043]|nr:hypothetical protein H0H87_002938 [Tephrocybe sp. NHM501043]
MTSTKAQTEKEKGNAAFKAGDFPTAIGHYSAAIIADGEDYTFPLNRAAAYLKLGKNEDAERDCTTVLELSALNAKALFRRGQARFALEKLEEASTDLYQALKREPTNAAVKDELKKVTELLEKKRAKVCASGFYAQNKTEGINQASRPTNALDSSKPTPKRRRVPIKIIDGAEAGSVGNSTSTEVPKATGSSSVPKESSGEPSVSKRTPTMTATASQDILKPVSTRTLKPEASSAALTPHTSSLSSPPPLPEPAAVHVMPSAPRSEAPRTYKDAKQARENGKTSRIGGGIFRASGESTVFPTKDYPVPSASVARGDPVQQRQTASTVLKPVTPIIPEQPPKTLFDFTRAWNANPTTPARWGLVLVRPCISPYDLGFRLIYESQSIPPTNFPTFFKISLDPAQLTSILAVFQEVLDASRGEKEKEMVREYMDAFGKVERFGTVALFLNRTEKAVAKGVWEALGVAKTDLARVWTPAWI